MKHNMTENHTARSMVSPLGNLGQFKKTKTKNWAIKGKRERNPAPRRGQGFKFVVSDIPNPPALRSYNDFLNNRSPEVKTEKVLKVTASFKMVTKGKKKTKQKFLVGNGEQFKDWKDAVAYGQAHSFTMVKMGAIKKVLA